MLENSWLFWGVNRPFPMDWFRLHAVRKLKASDSALDQTDKSAPLQAIVEEESLPESHSQDAADDERNREYLIRRAALGDNPTQEEMDAVVAYGLEQHRINFPEIHKNVNESGNFCIPQTRWRRFWP